MATMDGRTPSAQREEYSQRNKEHMTPLRIVCQDEAHLHSYRALELQKQPGVGMINYGGGGWQEASPGLRNESLAIFISAERWRAT
jgi:hypothetical protein